MLKQTLSLKLSQDQITGFSYSFSKALLDRLMELIKKDELFERYRGAGRGNGEVKCVTPVVKTILHYLKDQMPYIDWSGMDHASESQNDDLDLHEDNIKRNAEAKNIITQGYDFLKTFEKEKSKKKK